MKEPIRILHIVGGMHAGGMENFIMNLYRNIDRSKIQFDVIVHTKYGNSYEDEIEKLGGKIHELPRLTKHPVKNLRSIYKIVKTNRYPVVVRHTPNALITPQLIAARLAGAKTICHSHNVTDPQMTAHKLGRVLMPFAATRRIACSENAGKWMFNNKDFDIVHNAIDLERFMYNKEKADTIREEFHLGDCKVYGNIANFLPSKNHLFLLDIYNEISKIDENARFFCLGDGTLKNEINARINELNLQDKVFLTGSRDDVPAFMSCFDVLVFPSVFEGLPLTLIEAQAAGLQCLISDNITDEVVVSEGLINWESIEKAPGVWAKKAIELSDKKNRECQKTNIANHGYDIEQLVSWYEDYMIKLASN